MFTIARKALELMSGRVGGFKKAVAQPHKFCRGYGIFQYDLQHFRVDPAYFLEQRYLSFGRAWRRRWWNSGGAEAQQDWRTARA